ncbi:AI-2E family transporter [Legionella oakridgensis]|uniref:Transmembrane permease n=2 Tax=Legionella oakridgensis TaxID=29423 RepID=A0A0W0WZR8_9GAMM|nr:AI-2E family transporter [Legionella oakridgensis]AHE66584.1 putative permease [Legionella oakridgensis ATCC 33761 = DSM 21215]ETO93674.1 putative permease [Legionella oakridgensis RV-2-2007]KTD37815.1 transmembrane permease [Legionella oakridgensis]STY19732.1 transmembrane permease [Legionella longbeachae]
MNDSHKELISMGLTISIVALALMIIHRFIPSLLWAGIIVIATYPVYQRWCRLLGERHNIAAFLFTCILALLLIIPVSWLITLAVKEIQLFFNYLQKINREGGQAPAFLKDFPIVGNELVTYWNENVGSPGNVKYFLSNLHVSLTPASYYIKQVGVNIAHRGFQLGFTLLCLFFFYRDGHKLFQQINHIGELCLGKRWFRYMDRLPLALRATVNGTIVVGIGVGILMGICYGLVGFPGPTLTGFITAFAAMIPFVVPIVFTVVALILFANGSMIAAIIVIVWGTLVMFVADHFVKPVLIGGAIQLPFLAVLFGILGGVETLGLLGLFVGPIIMVLFITLWYESQGVTQANAANAFVKQID